MGLSDAGLEEIAGASPEENAAVTKAVLAGEPGPAQDVVLLNAGAAIMAAGVADDLAGGIERAADAIDSGAAREILDRLVTLTAELAAQQG